MKQRQEIEINSVDFNINKIKEDANIVAYIKKNYLVEYLSQDAWRFAHYSMPPAYLIIAESGQTHQVDEYLYVKHASYDEDGMSFNRTGFERELSHFFEEIGGVAGVLFLTTDERRDPKIVNVTRDAWGDDRWTIEYEYLRANGAQVNQVIFSPHEFVVIDDELLNGEQSWTVDSNYSLSDYSLSTVTSLAIVVTDDDAEVTKLLEDLADSLSV